MKEITFESTVNGGGINLFVTKNNEIMVETSDDGYITRTEIQDVVSANGFNTCFNTKSKQEFAKSCHFNNILITKKIFDEENNFEDIVCEFYLSELRKSKKKLEELLGE